LESFRAYVKNKSCFDNYKAVGLPLLVQTATFNMTPTKDNNNSNVYDKKKILEELRILEKEVVRFQINYKKNVYQVVGNGAKARGLLEKDKIMSTLQYRGLELTKWLRNFVKYMIARRDIEQEILDASLKPTHKEAMAWFESMTVFVNGCSNILLHLIARSYILNVLQAFIQYKLPPFHAIFYNKNQQILQNKLAQLKKQQNNNDNNNNNNNNNNNQNQKEEEEENKNKDEKEKENVTSETQQNLQEKHYEELFLSCAQKLHNEKENDKIREEAKTKFDAMKNRYNLSSLTSLSNLDKSNKKIEKVESRFLEIDNMIQLYSSIQQLWQSLQKNNTSNVNLNIHNLKDIENIFLNVICKDDNIKNEIEMAKKYFSLHNVRVPILEISAPLHAVDSNYQAPNSSIYKSYFYQSYHPLTQHWIRVCTSFIERCRLIRDVIFCLVYSNIDKKFLIYPTLITQPNKFFSWSRM